jgi:ATP-dependent HslUV protease subunit HslV
MKQKIRSTTVLCVRRDDKVVMAGDGQVTLGNEVIKASARKLRRLYNDKVLAGFAGSTADAFAPSWNSSTGTFAALGGGTGQGLAHGPHPAPPGGDPVGGGREVHVPGERDGDVIEPDEGIAAIGSGGQYALAAATALLRNTKLSARHIAEQAMEIAGKICILHQ